MTYICRTLAKSHSCSAFMATAPYSLSFFVVILDNFYVMFYLLFGFIYLVRFFLVFSLWQCELFFSSLLFLLVAVCAVMVLA